MLKKMTKLAAAVCMAALALALCAGCLGANAQVDEASKQYRTYMSQVNQIMVELDENLASFTDAVSRNDVVNMSSQLDQALKSLDRLDSLDVPSSMADIQKGYKEAASTLETALGDYVALYTEADAAVQAGTAKWSDYAEVIASIQERYDEGIKLLQDTDALAAKAGTL